MMIRALLIAFKCAVLLVVICVMGCICLYFYQLPQRLDPQSAGESMSYKEVLPGVPNGSGLVVEAHHTYNAVLLRGSTVYVYVHKTSEPICSRDLAFRYFDDPLVPEPSISWIDPVSVLISVGSVRQVTKAMDHVGNVNVHYSIGKEEYPRTAWLKDRHNEKIASCILLVVLLVLLYCCKIIALSVFYSVKVLSTLR